MPFTEGIRLNTGVDMVIFALKRFSGHLDQGRIEQQKLEALI